jgi:hypothetical protein
MAVAAEISSVRRSRTKSPAVAVTVAVAPINAAVPGYALRQSLSLLTHLDRSRLRYCFVLDNHLNARAHALFATRVSEIILHDLDGRP